MSLLRLACNDAVRFSDLMHQNLVSSHQVVKEEVLRENGKIFFELNLLKAKNSCASFLAPAFLVVLMLVI